MSDKKITDLQLRSNVNDDVNFPVDDGIQTYRVTGPQVATYALAAPRKILAKTANYTLVPGDHVINADASGGSFTLTLPTAVGIAGKIYKINRSDALSGSNVIIDGAGSETIDGATTFNVFAKESVTIISNNVNWDILDQKKVLGSVTIEHRETLGTNGGTAVLNDWTKRPLTTLQNPLSAPWVSLATDQITLAPGTYDLHAHIAWITRNPGTNSHRMRLYNVTDAAATILSTSNAISGLAGEDRNLIWPMTGTFKITSTKVFEIQYYLLRDPAGGGDYGYGEASSVDSLPEIYAQVKLVKLA